MHILKLMHRPGCKMPVKSPYVPESTDAGLRGAGGKPHTDAELWEARGHPTYQIYLHGTRHLVPGTWYLVSGTRYLVQVPYIDHIWLKL